jgi:hypothetical protein
MVSTRISSSLLALLVLALVSQAARADGISFKNRGNEEKVFITKVGEAIVQAAHPTGRRPALVEYKVTNPKPNRTEFTIKMEYYGAITGKRYVADIVVKIDSSNKEAWEVLNIDYSDNNNVAANVKNVQLLIKDLNK